MMFWFSWMLVGLLFCLGGLIWFCIRDSHIPYITFVGEEHEFDTPEKCRHHMLPPSTLLLMGIFMLMTGSVAANLIWSS